ncbi:hypothetical protein PTKIN_Ptkin12aG0099500 [Pterospermum kingtungense]
MNHILYFATVIDPTKKLEYVRFCFIEMYGDELAENLIKTVKRGLEELFNEFRKDTGREANKTEFDKYLAEDVETYENFDVLKWWKLNSLRYPILLSLARDILVVPISTVASESAFSISGHVLDAYRSSLLPKMVQALICTQNWLRVSPTVNDIEEDLEQLEKVEFDLSKIVHETTFD